MVDGYTYNLLCISYREPSQEQRVEQLKNRRVGANSQRQRKHCNNREGRVQPQHPRCVAQILQQRFHKTEAVHLPDLLVNSCQVAQFAPRSVARFFAGHSPRNEFFCFDLKVHLQFPLAFARPFFAAK